MQLCDCFLTMTPKCLALCGLVAALSLTSTVSVDKLEQKVKISHPADKCGSRDFSWSVRVLNMKPGEAVNWETSQTHTQRRWVECFFPMRGWQISINHINPHLTLPIPPPTTAFHSHCLPKSHSFYTFGIVSPSTQLCVQLPFLRLLHLKISLEVVSREKGFSGPAFVMNIEAFTLKTKSCATVNAGK